ncbi:MAG: hypothetical protein GEU90_17615 [Gemmatimonas sp.]|nr:hypothetical protein [Gemmatimonas sp.]
MARSCTPAVARSCPAVNSSRAATWPPACRAMVCIAGPAMTAMGRHPEASFAQLATEAEALAIVDAGLKPGVDAVVFANSLAGRLEGQHCVRGQVALQYLGLDHVPVLNVENACASGAAAFHTACLGLRASAYENVLVVGAERMSAPERGGTLVALRGAMDVTAADREQLTAGQRHSVLMEHYAGRTRTYLPLRGLELSDVACVAAKNAVHGACNPLAQRQRARSVEEVLEGPVVVDPLTRYMCAPITDGAAAVVVFPTRPGLRVRACALRSSICFGIGPRCHRRPVPVESAAPRRGDLAGSGRADSDEGRRLWAHVDAREAARRPRGVGLT